MSRNEGAPLSAVSACKITNTHWRAQEGCVSSWVFKAAPKWPLEGTIGRLVSFLHGVILVMQFSVWELPSYIFLGGQGKEVWRGHV